MSSGDINIVNPITKEILPKDLQAQEINTFFTNIGQNMASKFHGRIENYGPRAVLTIEPITQIEVLKLIDAISVCTFSGIENINS